MKHAMIEEVWAWANALGTSRNQFFEYFVGTWNTREGRSLKDVWPSRCRPSGAALEDSDAECDGRDPQSVSAVEAENRCG